MNPDDPPHRLCRSALYLPASNARAIEKARALACDAVILDLEDAVAPERKEEARQQATEALRARSFGARLAVLRVNAPGTRWGAEDMAAARDLPLDAVLIPKIKAPEDVCACRDALGPIPLWVMIETPRALSALQPIADAVGRGGALVMGTNDLALAMRCDGRAPLLPVLMLAIAAARASGRLVLDGVYNDFSDPGGFAAEAAQAVAMGFDGKTLIHPSQIAPCHAAFTPDDAAVRWAQAVVTAFAAPEARNAGAIQIEGKMVERLHLVQARRTLALSAAAQNAYAGVQSA